MRPSRRLLDGLRSPARLLALMRRLSEIVRRGEVASLRRRIRPRSFTSAEYRAWRAAQPALAAVAPLAPFVIALDPVDDDARTSLIGAFTRPPEGATMVLIRSRKGGWSPLAGGDASPLERLLGDAVGHENWIWWITQPLRLEPGAAHALADACQRPQTRLVYADHDVEDANGRPVRPVFKSAWDREQIVEHPYAGPLLVVHPALAHLVDRAGDATAGGQWGMLVDAASALPAEAVVHVPHVLAHLAWQRDARGVSAAACRAVFPRIMTLADGLARELEAHVDRTPWLRYRVPARCRISIVIPTRDRCWLLARCIGSLLVHGFGGDDEIVVVDNGSHDPALASLLEDVARQTSLKVVTIAEPFNFPKLCNAGVTAATGRVVVLLNNDTAVTDEASLSELVALAARPSIGAVGPLMLYPDGLVQSAGVLLGVNRIATSALAGYRRDDPAVRAWCASRRQVSAVIGACLAVERDKYLRVGGLDECFAVSHNELDFCLRLEAAGFANLFTPFASVIHREGGTRGFDLTPGERKRLEREEAIFRSRWMDVLAAVDPAHHPALACEGNPFALAPRPRSMRFRAGWRGDVSLLPARSVAGA